MIVIQGGESDRELFALIGARLMDKQVQQKIGMAPSSRVGDIWITEGDGEQFLCARLLENRNLHVRMVYCASGEASDYVALLLRAVEFAQKHGCRGVWAREKKTEAWLEPAGFTAIIRERGNYCRWELTLGDSR